MSSGMVRSLGKGEWKRNSHHEDPDDHLSDIGVLSLLLLMTLRMSLVKLRSLTSDKTTHRPIDVVHLDMHKGSAFCESPGQKPAHVLAEAPHGRLCESSPNAEACLESVKEN